MIKGYLEYVNEVLGADSMEKDPADLVMNPDTKRASGLMLHAGTSGAIPTHWNNSPFLAGGRLTSAFGLNPKTLKKKSVLNYHEFVKASKSVSSK